MGINPVSDLVFDVMRNAKPEAMRAATERLSASAGVGASREASQDFAKQLDAVAVRHAKAPSGAVQQNVALEAKASLLDQRPSVVNKQDPKTQFDAFVLKTFVEAMLPKETEGLFGTGTAGEFWRSMLAEKIAEQLAASTQLSLLPDPNVGPQPTDDKNSSPVSQSRDVAALKDGQVNDLVSQINLKTSIR